MKGMIKKDLFMIKNNQKALIVSLLIYIIYPFMFNIDMSFFLPLMGLIVCISTINQDDFNNWNTYATSLPQGKINVVKSKYIITIGMILITTLIGIISSIIMSKINTKIILDESISTIMGELIAIIFMMSVLFPIIFKFGFEKGRIFTIIIGILIYGIVIISSKFIQIETINNIINFIKTYYIIIFITISIMLLSISYIISKKIYLKKEF